MVDYLVKAEPFDAAYAIGTLGFIDPHRAPPALRDGLRPGAPLIISLLHTDLHDRGGRTARADEPVAGRPAVGHPDVGLGTAAVEVPAHRVRLASRPSTCYAIAMRARRSCSSSSEPAALPTGLPRGSGRPRRTQPPAPHAAFGVGVTKIASWHQAAIPTCGDANWPTASKTCNQRSCWHFGTPGNDLASRAVCPRAVSPAAGRSTGRGRGLTFSARGHEASWVRLCLSELPRQAEARRCAGRVGDGVARALAARGRSSSRGSRRC